MRGLFIPPSRKGKGATFLFSFPPTYPLIVIRSIVIKTEYRRKCQTPKSKEKFVSRTQFDHYYVIRVWNSHALFFFHLYGSNQCQNPWHGANIRILTGALQSPLWRGRSSIHSMSPETCCLHERLSTVNMQKYSLQLKNLKYNISHGDLERRRLNYIILECFTVK